MPRINNPTINYVARQASQSTARLTSNLRVAQDVNTVLDESVRDNLGRLKVSRHQNLYEADFEYGTQPLRWESFTTGTGSVTHLPALGGVRMRIQAAGDVTIRQSRPYHRYQPGKSMYMASAVNFGVANVGQIQRVGFLDDSNGVFIEQADPTPTNPYGMFLVVRSDSGGNTAPVNTRISYENWLAPAEITNSLNWNNIQMVWIEYAWYGAGTVRWGVFIDGEPVMLHKIGFGNLNLQANAWSRTGNLPVRYEQRNITSNIQNDMVHFGVSVLAEGGVDDQRGFTYSYGMAPITPQRTVTAGVKFPLLSFRGRQMGTQEFTQAATPSTGGTTNTLTIGAITLPSPVVANSNASNVGTLGFGTPHGLFVGQSVTLAGFTPAGYNGTFNVLAVLNAYNITVQLASNPGVGTVFGTATTTWFNNQWAGRFLNVPAAPIPLATTASTSNASNIGTIVFASAHGLTVGQTVTLAGFTPAGYNGTWSVLAILSSTIVNLQLTSNPGLVTIVGTGTANFVSRIQSNTPSTLTLIDNVLGTIPFPVALTAGLNYTIGQINRGQVLPRTLFINSSAVCIVEIYASTTQNPVILTAPAFTSMVSLGANNSFAERDVTATAMTGGELVFSFVSPTNQFQTIDLSNLFPLYNTIRGGQTDILTVAITGTANVGANFLCQEAMS